MTTSVEHRAYTRSQLAARFWRLAFMDQVRWQSVLRRLEESGEHIEKPIPGVNITKLELERVVRTMLVNGVPLDDPPFELLWPVIKSEVERFGIDAEKIAYEVEVEWSEDDI